MADTRRLWKLRSANRPSAVLLVVGYDAPDGIRRGRLAGLHEGNVTTTDPSLDSVATAAEGALRSGSTRRAESMLGAFFQRVPDDHPVVGLRNEGLFATHELVENVPRRADWADAVTLATSLIDESGEDLVRGLGWTVRRHGEALLLGTDERREAVAIILQGDEVFDRTASRLGHLSPVEYAISVAHREGLRWVIAVQDAVARLYTSDPDTGVGRRGSATYTEVDLRLLDPVHRGYPVLLLTPTALRKDGTVDEILEGSRNHATALATRLRERVYRGVIPELATAVARKLRARDEGGLDRAYHVTLVILFRLLFVAYAEDRGLLPYGDNIVYTRKSLKTRAREYATQRDSGVVKHDQRAKDVWTDLVEIWSAVRGGHTEWGVPAYGGGLFDETTETGRAIDGMSLTNDRIGRALERLLVDTGPGGLRGPVDFQALSVREFGTIYEGLLESSLSMAPTDLALDKNDAYVPAKRARTSSCPPGRSTSTTHQVCGRRRVRTSPSSSLSNISWARRWTPRSTSIWSGWRSSWPAATK